MDRSESETTGGTEWPSSTRRPLRTYAVPLSSAYPPASSPAATKLRMLVLCLGPIGGYGGAGPEAAAPLPPTRAAARGASPPTILAHTSLVRATRPCTSQGLKVELGSYRRRHSVISFGYSRALAHAITRVCDGAADDVRAVRACAGSALRNRIGAWRKLGVR